MIRILAQRVGLVDQSGLMRSDWFRMFESLIKQVNKYTTTSASGSESVTGTATETEAVSMNVFIGKSGSALLTMATTCTNNANAKTVAVTLGGTTIQTYTIDPTTDTQTMQLLIVGRGTDQYITALSSVNATGSGSLSSSLDLSSTVTLAITLQLADSADTITLESWLLNVEQS